MSTWIILLRLLLGVVLAKLEKDLVLIRFQVCDIEGLNVHSWYFEQSHCFSMVSCCVRFDFQGGERFRFPSLEFAVVSLFVVTVKCKPAGLVVKSASRFGFRCTVSI